MYAITLHQPRAALIALGLKTVAIRSRPAPARLVGQRIAVPAGKRLVREPGERIERELRAQWGKDWRMIIATGAVVATAVVAGIARVVCADLLEGCAVHSPDTEHGCAVQRGKPQSILGATSVNGKPLHARQQIPCNEWQEAKRTPQPATVAKCRLRASRHSSK